MRPLLLAPLLLLALALPAAAAPDLSGAYELIGQDAVGRYRGVATLTQTAQGRVEGSLTLEYVRWSWSAYRYVPTGRHGAARVEGRAVGSQLRGVRRTDAGLAGLLGLTGSLNRSIRYTIHEQAGRITAVRGSYGGAWEQLHRHRPVTDARTRDLLALRAELEAATSGMLWMSESDYPFRWVQLDGAAGISDLAAFRARIGVEAARPAEQRTLVQTFGWRLQHQPGETPEEAAEVERYVRLKALLESKLTDLRVYRVGDAQSTSLGDLLGEVTVYIVGKNAHGDLVGLTTISVET